MAVSSDEVNLLVYRYLLESGFTHSAFVFGYESFVHKNAQNGKDIPPGALITFLQKGLQYVEMEAQISDEVADLEGGFASLSAHDLLTKDLDELKLMVREARDAAEENRGQVMMGMARRGEEGNGAMPMDEDAPQGRRRDGGNIVAPPESVTVLSGHSGEVFVNAWCPTSNVLASGAGDSTVRLWDFDSPRPQQSCLVLRHPRADGSQESMDVTSLDWSSDGSTLATATYDGVCRLWNKSGQLVKQLVGHKGPIFATRWNKKGDLLLTGSMDKTAAVWDTRTGELRQRFSVHEAPTLDVDWRNNTMFATCSTDKTVCVCKVNEPTPLKRFVGHTEEVNAIRWDPQGRLLASGSDDASIRLWSMNSDEAVQHLLGHKQQIYCIRWSPSGPGTPNPNAPVLLASSSIDGSVRLWDVETSSVLHCLDKHDSPVYSIAFSPDAQYLASGSFDKQVLVWSVKDGSLVRSYTASGGAYELTWDGKGEQLGVCLNNKTVIVLDMRM